MSGGLSRMLRSAARNGLSALGYELRRKPCGHVWGVDAYADQVELLRGTTVRTIFDVGANIGQTTATYRGLYPAATIHAFEPFPEAYERLVQAYVGCSLVIPHRVAASEHTGTTDFYVNQSDVTNSLLLTDPRSEVFVDPAMTAGRAHVTVAAVRLDDFCHNVEVDHVDILKMDIQGGEGLAVRGASALLCQRRVGLIYAEVLFAPLYRGQTSFGELTALLKDFGYSLFGLYELRTMHNGLAWGDAIYLPEGSRA